MGTSREATARILALLDRLPRQGERRALALGSGAERWLGALRERGYEAIAAESVSTLDLPPESVSLVLAAGVLGEDEWDRWAMQRAHRTLVDGGHFVVEAPGKFSIGTPDGIAFLLGRVPREIGIRLRRALGRPVARERFRGRRYRLDAVESMLESLGYQIEQRSAHDFGWLGPLAGTLGRERVAGTFVLHCRRGPSLFGLDPRRPFPDPDAHRRRFESAHRRFVEDRERWLARHPQHRPASIVELEPGAHGGANVLVLAPHPDDELIGCGGTLIRLIAAGARVTVIHATDGSEAASLWHAPEAERRNVRLEEARRVGEALGVEKLVFWREDNASFRERDERVRELAEILTATRPALIFTPFVTDVHPDHRILSRMLARAIEAVPEAVAGAKVLSYQVWSLLPPSHVCDVTDAMPGLERALLLYPTAMKVEDYVHFCQDRNYWIAAGKAKFMEAYYDTAAGEFPRHLQSSGDPL